MYLIRLRDDEMIVVYNCLNPYSNGTMYLIELYGNDMPRNYQS